MAKVKLYRAAEDDIVTDSASFSEDVEAAKAYLDREGSSGGKRKLWTTTIDPHAVRVLDVVEEDDPTEVIADFLGKAHPGSIGADEYVPRVSYELRDLGIEWVRVLESYPEESITWIWVGGDDPEMKRYRAPSKGRRT